MNNVELYIKNESDNYIPVDIFEDENIQIEDSIQDVRDISKIFNTFTRDFKVPASFENNKLFKHYYNINIDNGFDGRIKTRALIKVGGADYKEGYLKMLGVGLKDNKPSTYKVTFQGLTTSLKDVLQDKELKDLNYNDLLFDNNTETKVEAIRTGLFKGGSAEQDDNGYDLYPDIIYAPIFSHGKVVAIPFRDDVNSSNATGYGTTARNFTLTKFTGIGKTNTLQPFEDGATEFRNFPVTVNDYKPSVKMGRLIRMIGEQYGLNFKKSFYQLEELDQMYVHYNGKQNESENIDISSAFNSNVGNNTDMGLTALNSIEYTTEAVSPSGVLPFPLNVSYNDWDRRYTESGTAGISSYNYYDVFHTRAVFKAEWTDANSSPPAIKFSICKFYRDDNGNKVILSRNGYNEERVSNSTNNYLMYSSIGMNGFYQNNASEYQNTVPDNKAVEFSMIIESSESLSSLRVGVQYLKGSYYVNGTTTGAEYYTGTFQQAFFSWVHDGATVPLTQQEIAFANVQASAYLDIVSQAPELKLIDLLLGVFKMLNLTSYVNNDGSIEVLPLRNYYYSGKTIDITDYVDTDSHSVQNGFVYRDVKMKHEEASDILSKNFASNEASIKYGDITISEESFLGLFPTPEIVDGKDYNIKSPFARMMFERLTLAVTDTGTVTNPSGNAIYSAAQGGALTDMVIGNCIDDKLEEVETKPIIFFGKRVDQDANYVTSFFEPDDISEIGGRVLTTHTERGNQAGAIGADANTWPKGLVLTQPGATSTNANHLVSDSPLLSDNGVNLGEDGRDYWWNPSGIMASRLRRDSSTFMNPFQKFVSLSFDGDQAYDEFEYPNNLASSEWIVGLYQNGYEDYLENLYKKNARISKYKVHFSPSLINSYSLNDTVIVGTNEYNINSIKINLLTGKGDIELINKIELTDFTETTLDNSGAFAGDPNAGGNNNSGGDTGGGTDTGGGDNTGGTNGRKPFSINTSKPRSSSSAACGIGVNSTLYWHDGNYSYPTVNDRVYSSSTGSPFNGNGLWYYASGLALNIDSSGVVDQVVNCLPVFPDDLID